jgi:ribosomal protein S27AE
MMRIPSLLLADGADGKRRARFKPMTGADELSLFGCDFAEAVEWLAGMLVQADGCIAPEDLKSLALEDADLLFEAVYRALFGGDAELRQRCPGCGESYELKLALDNLFPRRDGRRPGAPAGPERLPSGTLVRALTLNDLAGGAETPSAMLEQAILERGTDEPGTIESAIERLSSSHVETVETACPNCGQPQSFAFDLSDFLLRCCARERPILLREIHLLARTYQWSFSDIVSLDRAARHEMVKLAVSATPSRSRMRAA